MNLSKGNRFNIDSEVGFKIKKEHRKSQNTNNSSKQFFEIIAVGSGLGFTIVIPIIGGVILGRYIDYKYNIAPIFTLSLLFLGMIIAFISIFKILKDYKN